jgi:ATP-dependent helicase/nuclease subunit A
MSFTPEQEKAINAPGNILVAAGAGAGKTRTLVERCVSLMLRADDPVAIKDLLVVTFTEAAAAEMRERIRLRLEAELARGNDWLQEQLAKLDEAHISTLHSFCFVLVRQHFYQLELDPAVTVMDQTQAEMLLLSTIDAILQEHYAGEHPFSGELQELIRVHFNGWDKPLRQFIRELHHFTQTRPDPSRWLENQLRVLAGNDSSHWRAWYRETLQEWCTWWLPYLRSLPAENVNAHMCAKLLECGGDSVQKILDQKDQWPARQKRAHSAPFERFFAEAAFLASLQNPGAIEEDWEFARGPLKLLLTTAIQFSDRFSAAKRERGVLDFHDLEQMSLRLLWNNNEEQPSAVAREWQQRFRAVFVDEYQDINRVQDQIIRALSPDQPPGNRFLVGDIKQSIYRFRQADPSIFRAYFNEKNGWEQACLSHNFRSHEAILDFVNPLFGWLMRPEVGGIEYDDRLKLRFGEHPAREPMKSPTQSVPNVELNVLLKEKGEESAEPGAASAFPELDDVEKEAHLVAARLREIEASKLEIYDQALKAFRVVRWRDMIVLLRSAAGKFETYARAFEQLGVPLHTRRDTFYKTQEVLDICSLLQILDNPLQDIPLLAVLRSPLVGLTANELAGIRISSQLKPFWYALMEFQEKKIESSAREKTEAFLQQFHSWRSARSITSLSDRLERILADTGYADWLLGQPRGRQRYANIQELLRIARQFDEARGESLYQFLLHVEELREAVGDVKPSGIVQEDAVQLMTVHQSKGLEFPIVALAGLGSTFNRSDERQPVLFHEKYGVCSMIKPPDFHQRYPSLPLWAARRQERIDNLGEEMRILYVALTRAQNHLFLFGSTTKNRAHEKWQLAAVEKPFPRQVLEATCALDWIGAFSTLRTPDWLDQEHGVTNLFAYRIHRRLAEPLAAEAVSRQEIPLFSREQLQSIRKGIDFAYPHETATRQQAKTNVTALRRRATEDDEAAPIVARSRAGSSGDGRDRGLGYHILFQYLDLESDVDRESIDRQCTELRRQNMLSEAQFAQIDGDAVVAFWRSDFGAELLRHRKQIRRELRFTFRLDAEALQQAGLGQLLTIPPGEFVVLQGMADLVIFFPKEMWLLDFKTDAVELSDLNAALARYSSQLTLYSLALSSIYKRPVTRKGIYFVNVRRLEWL